MTRPAPPSRPPLTVELVLHWCDDFRDRHARWPRKDDRDRGLADRSWGAVDRCLGKTFRGVPGHTSLARLLATYRGRRHKGSLPPLTVPRILAWADAHHGRTGSWPRQTSGPVPDAPGETWAAIDAALAFGRRGLDGGSSLARLLHARRDVRSRSSIPPLSVNKILLWARTYHDRTGDWPCRDSGTISGTFGETWKAVDGCLKCGRRGLRPGQSLAQILARHCGVRNVGDLSPLTVESILAWADAHHTRTGRWPTAESGPLPKPPGETWLSIETALAHGTRGLPPGDTLARLLARHRGKRNLAALPPLTESAILAWADAHHRRTGDWPGKVAGPVDGAPGETWAAVNHALRRGRRGLPGGSTLARLLETRRGVRNRAHVPPLTVEEILSWADAHHARTGRWPAIETPGPIPDTSGDTWSAVNRSLAVGYRGLPGGSSLAKLLAERRGVRNPQALPPLTREAIRDWAEAHRARTGKWPVVKGGPIPDSGGETWAGVNVALEKGLRGLPGGESLARLLAAGRGGRDGRG